MRITTNEKYSCWALLGTQTFWTCSKLSYWPAEAIRTRRTLFKLIVIVIARMTRNDQEWSPEQTWIVNSSSFGSRFGTVGLGHYRHLWGLSPGGYKIDYTCHPHYLMVDSMPCMVGQRLLVIRCELVEIEDKSKITFVGLCAAFWSIFLRKNSPQITHAKRKCQHNIVRLVFVYILLSTCQWVHMAFAIKRPNVLLM